MQTKIFLSFLLATFSATGVIATPAAINARDLRSDHGPPTELSKVGTPVGAPKPFPKGTIITPKANDVPVASSNLDARDLESLEKRTAGCIFVSADEGFKGNNLYICIATNGGCTNWDDYWRRNISAFGPDPGTTCQLFHDPQCGGGATVAFGYPGYSVLGPWNDNMGSFRCWW